MKTLKNKIVYEELFGNAKGKALSIVFPSSDEELCNLAKLSQSDIIPRGGGTSFTGGCFPDNSVIIDFSKNNKILSIDPAKKTAYVESGVLIDELNEELEQYGLEFPIMPLFSGIETIGGVIAKNSSGSRELKYGRAIKWIESLEIIDGTGKLSKLNKSELGDFVGMEGITGMILRAKLKLTSLKSRSLSILKSSNLQEITKVNNKLRLNHDICSIDLLGKEVSYLLGFEKKYHLLVEYETSEGLFKKDEYKKFMHIKNRAYSRLAEQGFSSIESIKLFSENTLDFIFHLEQSNIPYFSHLSFGVIYACLKPEDKIKQENMLESARKMHAELSYNLGLGITKKYVLDKNNREIIKRVKARRDPFLKFNRNKLIDVAVLKNNAPEPEKSEESAELLIEEQSKPEENIEKKTDEIKEPPVEESKTEEAKEQTNEEPQNPEEKKDDYRAE